MESSQPPTQHAATPTGYLSAADAFSLDQDLMQTPGYTLDQLMELAGLSVAEAVVQIVPTPASKILIICGPGNNGGDGLVAARHLMFFGYKAVVVYPKQTNRHSHYSNLVKQCQDLGIPILEHLPNDLDTYAAMVDAIFGFSFQGTPREPFQTILEVMMKTQQQNNVPIISVDVPSGWNVDDGDVSGTGFLPEYLVSLTAPKNSSRSFTGRHFCGGRFLPPKLAAKYNIQMPNYPGVSQVVELKSMYSWEQDYAQHCADQERQAPILVKEPSADSWETGYAAYCAEKESELARKDDAAKTVGPTSTSTSNSWVQEYAAYCADKEQDSKSS